MATVKEATGNLDNMRQTRKCCGPDYTILSGDDALTYDMMTDAGILAAGVISVVSNVVPAAMADNGSPAGSEKQFRGHES